MRNLLVIALALSVVVFLKTVGGRVEGVFWPVVSLGQIDRIETVGETRVRFWGHATRLRTCSFERLDWYLGEPSAHSRADLVFEEGTKVRASGEFEFGAWVVQLTPEQLYDRSYAIVYHRCHIFWLTETLFYN